MPEELRAHPPPAGYQRLPMRDAIRLVRWWVQELPADLARLPRFVARLGGPRLDLRPESLVTVQRWASSLLAHDIPVIADRPPRWSIPHADTRPGVSDSAWWVVDAVVRYRIGIWLTRVPGCWFSVNRRTDAEMPGEPLIISNGMPWGLFRPVVGDLLGPVGTPSGTAAPAGKIYDDFMVTSMTRPTSDFVSPEPEPARELRVAGVRHRIHGPEQASIRFDPPVDHSWIRAYR